MLYVMKIIKEAEIKLKGEVMVTGVIGKERKSEGTEYLVKSAHGGRPRLVINAIEKSAVLVNAIKEQLIPKLKERYSIKWGLLL